LKWRIAPLGAIGLLMAVGINALLLTSVATQIASDGPAVSDKVEWKPNLSASTGGVANRRPIETYREILARPVFFRSREPYVTPPPPPPPPPVTVIAPPPVVIDPGLVLGGVMIKNDIKKAYVFSRAGGGGAWAAEGDEYMGWKIKSIDKSGAKLEQMGRAIDLQLYPRE
jgi:hypothetical protein